MESPGSGGVGQGRRCKGRRIAESDRRFPFFKGPISEAQTNRGVGMPSDTRNSTFSPTFISHQREQPSLRLCLSGLLSSQDPFPLLVTPAESLGSARSPFNLLCSADTLLQFLRKESTGCQRASLALSSLHDIWSPGSS